MSEQVTLWRDNLLDFVMNDYLTYHFISQIFIQHIHTNQLLYFIGTDNNRQMNHVDAWSNETVHAYNAYKKYNLRSAGEKNCVSVQSIGTPLQLQLRSACAHKHVHLFHVSQNAEMCAVKQYINVRSLSFHSYVRLCLLSCSLHHAHIACVHTSDCTTHRHTTLMCLSTCRVQNIVVVPAAFAEISRARKNLLCGTRALEELQYSSSCLALVL